MNKLDSGKVWVRKTLHRLTRAQSVQMWWWERTSPSEWTLCLVGRDETRRVSVSFHERDLRAVATDAIVQAEITKRLIAAIDGLTAPVSEPEEPDASG